MRTPSVPLLLRWVILRDASQEARTVQSPYARWQAQREGLLIDDMDARTEMVKTLLTPGEFVLFSRWCERKGLSHSAGLRMCALDAINADLARDTGPMKATDLSGIRSVSGR